MAKASAKQPFGFRIEPGLLKQIERVAKEKDRSVSWIARYLLKKGLAAEANSKTEEAA